MHSTAPDEGRTTPKYKHALMFNENFAHFIGSTTVYIINKEYWIWEICTNIFLCCTSCR